MSSKAPCLALWFTALFLLAGPAKSQSGRIRHHQRRAEDAITYNRYDKALPHYLYLLGVDSNNFDYNFKTGICYANLPEHKDESVKYFLKASQVRVKDTV